MPSTSSNKNHNMEAGKNVNSKVGRENQDEHIEREEEEEQYDALGLSIVQDQVQNDKQKIEQEQESEEEERENYPSPNKDERNENPLAVNNKNDKREESENEFKTNLHEQHPTLSKAFQEEKHHEKLHENEEKNNERSEEENENESSEHIANLDHSELIKLDENENVVVEEHMEKSNESLATEKKFERYLNEQIYKIGGGESPIDMRPNFAIGSPISLPYNFSLRSVDSSFYRPENHSLNLSRSYIPNFQSLGNPTIYEFSPLDSKEGIEKKLRFIFDYYAESYLQLTKKYETFDVVGKRVMKFQSFILFAKDFKLLKNIFKLDTIKKVYKKESEFGKVLQFSNFLRMLETLSHEKECNDYFKLDHTVPGMNAETKAELESRELNAYMGLHENFEKLKSKFSKIFLPFNCDKEAELPKIKFNYKKLSLPDLHRKALPELSDTKPIKSRITMKSEKKVMNNTLFDNENEVLVSWQMLRSKSLKNMEAVKHSTIKVKKLIKEDPEDKIYLNEYREIKSLSRNMVERKIKEIKTIEDKKSHRMLENLQRIDDKILLSKLNLQKKLIKNKI